VAELSPAAQAVLASYHKEAIDYIESWGSFSHKRGMAAALRAAADQVVPHLEEPDWGACNDGHCDIELYTDHQRKRAKLLAIAAELDKANNTSEGGFDA
jgi:hypothetical protein